MADKEADSVNNNLRDAVLRHAIDLHRYSNATVRKIQAVIASANDGLLTALAEALQRAADTGLGSEFNMRRLDDLLTGVRNYQTQAYTDAFNGLQGDLRDFADYETQFQSNMVNAATPDDVQLTTPNSGTAYAAAEALPFQGRLLSEWFDGLEAGSQQRLRDTIAQGFVRGDTIDTMIKSVRGTRAQGYSDGILAIDTRNAEAVVRTAVGHVASVAREEFVAANKDVIDSVQWVSTLDNRTTDECAIRDGLVYTTEGEPIGHDVPWDEGPGNLHWNCRSTFTYVIASAAKLGLDLPPAERAAMDGTVPASTSYGEWLTGQSAKVQDDVLGPTRGAMLRSGEQSFNSFYSDKGTFLTLDQLKNR